MNKQLTLEGIEDRVIKVEACKRSITGGFKHALASAVVGSAVAAGVWVLEKHVGHPLSAQHFLKDAEIGLGALATVVASSSPFKLYKKKLEEFKQDWLDMKMGRPNKTEDRIVVRRALVESAKMAGIGVLFCTAAAAAVGVGSVALDDMFHFTFGSPLVGVKDLQEGAGLCGAIAVMLSAGVAPITALGFYDERRQYRKFRKERERGRPLNFAERAVRRFSKPNTGVTPEYN